MCVCRLPAANLQENAKFHMKLNELYTSRRPRSAGNPGGIYREVGLGCLKVCRTFLGLYAHTTRSCLP